MILGMTFVLPQMAAGFFLGSALTNLTTGAVGAWYDEMDSRKVLGHFVAGVLQIGLTVWMVCL